MTVKEAKTEVMAVLGDEPMSFPEIVIAIVVKAIGDTRLTEQSLELCQRLDFPVRDAVWNLVAGGEAKFTPNRLVYRNPGQ